MNRRVIVGLGELLWDLLPDGASLGGAPANFAYVTRLFGDHGFVASRVGRDSRGQQALDRMRQLGLGVDHVQIDSAHATGTVNVEIDAKGQARFEIADPVAWDFLEWTPDWKNLAKGAEAVCFGSLAQRSATSRATIRNFLDGASDAVRVFDVNLRQSYYSPEILSESMKRADIVKVNDEELPKIMALSGFSHRDERHSAQYLLAAFDLKLICVTRGARGSIIVAKNGVDEHPGFHVKVADTVGSGDAFTAALTHEYLKGSSLGVMNETANQVGAWVASQSGGMPVPAIGLADSLSEMTWTQIPRDLS
jgi:fructokinase